MYHSAFPIITTPDLARALGFYRDLLDGAVSYRFPESGPPVYVSLELAASHLGIGEDSTAVEATGPQRFSLWVYATDCSEAIERLRANGVQIVEEPVDQPWGERVARVVDPDGNVVIVGSPPPG